MYRYPDVNDLDFNKNVINADWEDGGMEEFYLRTALKYECSGSVKSEKHVILDAGCGHGRLFYLLDGVFKNIICLDADIDRLNVAKKAAKMHRKHLQATDFVHSTILDYETQENPDCVLCCQVIQHVPTYDVEAILVKFKNFLLPRGKLILSSTNCLEERDKFSMINTRNGEYRIVTEKEFNQCAEDNNHFLPTRYFCANTLRTLLINAGFTIIFEGKYHGFPKLRGDNFFLTIKY